MRPAAHGPAATPLGGPMSTVATRIETDSIGEMDWSWEVTGFTNILNRLTHADYMTTLYAGMPLGLASASLPT